MRLSPKAPFRSSYLSDQSQSKQGCLLAPEYNLGTVPAHRNEQADTVPGYGYLSELAFVSPCDFFRGSLWSKLPK